MYINIYVCGYKHCVYFALHIMMLNLHENHSFEKEREREGERKINKFASIWSFNICQLVSKSD